MQSVDENHFLLLSAKFLVWLSFSVLCWMPLCSRDDGNQVCLASLKTFVRIFNNILNRCILGCFSILPHNKWGSWTLFFFKSIFNLIKTNQIQWNLNVMVFFKTVQDLTPLQEQRWWGKSLRKGKLALPLAYSLCNANLPYVLGRCHQNFPLSAFHDLFKPLSTDLCLWNLKGLLYSIPIHGFAPCFCWLK